MYHYTSAYYNRGVGYGRKGELDKEIADFTEALRLNPKHFDAHYYRGVAYGKKEAKPYNEIADFDRDDPARRKICQGLLRTW